ncbi:MAG: hypothetical protein UW26_C0031G0001 [Candidatus Collierbacteria bacterium GW2011_GWF1_44_12]|uniref:Uncharacterized protein n=1 Tax=Candidatus Collierbacteria bacterium GW2011_GWF1_44_12 TaxID=1618402 RepID=A0A0G1J0A0_9BACT|nr:MAG: hypothetical protein UW26_C0031G0001 [Candidatus Collierbacteria bacterium GW2011_GWF1_44_12]
MKKHSFYVFSVMNVTFCIGGCVVQSCRKYKEVGGNVFKNIIGIGQDVGIDFRFNESTIFIRSVYLIEEDYVSIGYRPFQISEKVGKIYQIVVIRFDPACSFRNCSNSDKGNDFKIFAFI